jgi:tetratricopeptide (TPR) repeat protein
MEKDRTRRYDSAGELAADIVRHLNDEPVTAGPPSTLYRMRKYARRHRPLVTGLAAVLVVLLAGIAGIVVFAVKADRQARTVQAVADFLNKDLLGSVALQQAMSQQVTVHSILDTASAQLEGKFANKPLVEASIRQTLGQTYIELGDYRQAEPHLRRAYDLRRMQLGKEAPLTLTSLSQLGRVYLLQAHYKEAEPLLVQSLESRRRVLGPDHADTLESSVWRGLVYAELLAVGLAERAEKLLTTAFESCSYLLGKKDPITLEAMYGLAYLRGAVQGRLDEAAPLCLEGWETARNVLGEGHRLAVQFMVLAAWFEAWSGQSEEAQHHAQTALEMNQRVLGKEHPDTLLAMATLGMVCAIRNDLEQAESLLTESLPLLRSSLGEAHGNKLFFTQWLARVYMCQGRYREAEQLLVKMIEDGRPSFGDDSLLMMEGRRNMRWLYAMQERNNDLKTWGDQACYGGMRTDELEGRWHNRDARGCACGNG